MKDSDKLDWLLVVGGLALGLAAIQTVWIVYNQSKIPGETAKEVERLQR